MTEIKGATLVPAGEPDKANGTAMVVVGCKLPNGLMIEQGRFGDENHRTVRLNGANSSRVIGGFGLTEVSKSFWEGWLKAHRSLDFVKKGMVFVHTDMDSATDFAKERAEIKSGLEALNPQKDERIKGVKDPSGKPLVELDQEHFNDGRRAVMQASQAMR